MAKPQVIEGGSLRAYARHRGVTLRAVQKARDTGRITLVNGKVPDFGLADQEWEQRMDPDYKIRRESAKSAKNAESATARKPPQAIHGPSEYEQVKTKRESLRATREELELAKLQNSLIPAEEVAAAQEARAAQEREALLNWPSRVSGDLAAALKIPERTLFGHLDREVRRFLAERSGQLLSDAA